MNKEKNKLKDNELLGKYSVSDVASLLNVGKSTILKVAVNKNMINTLEYNRKLKKFSITEFKIIKEEIKRNINNEKYINVPLYKQSENVVDISENWDNDFFENFKVKRKYKFVDLFSGAGGIAAGFTMAGFEPIQNFEIFHEANLTYKLNFKVKRNIVKHEIDEYDVTKIKEYKNILNNLKKSKPEIIVGGFPCQGFSISGIRSWHDPRNVLYESMFQLVEKIKPKIVVMENVLGILSMKDSNGKLVVNNIMDVYRNAGYKIDYKVLNAADYGVPQLRKRVIFIANKLGIENLFPKPILAPEAWVSSKKVLEKFKLINEDLTINHIFTHHKPETIEKMKKLNYGESLYKNFSDSWKKIDPDKPSPTIKENHGGVNIHYSENRVLTPRELAALQSFPDDFIFSGNKSKQLVQIGNAVPPLLAKAIACSLIKMLEKTENNKK